MKSDYKWRSFEKFLFDFDLFSLLCRSQILRKSEDQSCITSYVGSIIRSLWCRPIRGGHIFHARITHFSTGVKYLDRSMGKSLFSFKILNKGDQHFDIYFTYIIFEDLPNPNLCRMKTIYYTYLCDITYHVQHLEHHYIGWSLANFDSHPKIIYWILAFHYSLYQFGE